MSVTLGVAIAVQERLGMTARDPKAQSKNVIPGEEIVVILVSMVI